MWNFLGVVCGTVIFAWALFIRRPSAGKMLSASRWMLFSWGMLFLVYCFSPITFLVLSVSWRVWAFSAVWVGSFVLADNVHFTLFVKSQSARAPLRAVTCTATNMRLCAMLAAVGALLLVYTHRQSLISGDSGSLMAQLRETQLQGEDLGVLTTVATVLACGGLPVVLVEASRAVQDQSKIQLRGWIGLLAYFVVTIITGGRPGFVLGALSLVIAVISSVKLSVLGFVRFRNILIVGVLVTITSIGYIVYVVSTRTIGYTGDMDSKITLVNSLLATDLDPGFRDSLKPFGVFGDTVVEVFYYLGTQFPGLDFALRHFRGPYGAGLHEVPYIARRLESISGTAILDPVVDAHNRMFEKIGVFPHFFDTAAGSTLRDFGVVLSFPFVFLSGVLSRRARYRALLSREPFSIALQALICTGAAWTIIMSPWEEQSWAFPLMWFISIYVAHRVAAFLQGPLSTLSKIRTV